MPADQVVLVAAVGVAGRVGVVLEQVDVAGDALVVQPPLGVDEQPLEDPLPRLVVGDEVDDVVALGGGVLRVAADVEVETGAVAEEDVAAAAPGDHLAEQVAGNLVRREAPLPAERAGDAVLVLDPEDPAVHVAQTRRTTQPTAAGLAGLCPRVGPSSGPSPRLEPACRCSERPLRRPGQPVGEPVQAGSGGTALARASGATGRAGRRGAGARGSRSASRRIAVGPVQQVGAVYPRRCQPVASSRRSRSRSARWVRLVAGARPRRTRGASGCRRPTGRPGPRTVRRASASTRDDWR